ncbi:MAG TPA: hypothetical protein VLL72_11220, partial [Kiloniellales bacterium]|nr:hypothetical protein [Kiloniellales bacterium]
KGILEVLLRAAKHAIRGYENICNLTFGKDGQTYDLALANLYDEIAHEASLLKVSRSLTGRAR